MEWLERGLLDLVILLDLVDIDKYEMILLLRKEKWGLFILENVIFVKKDVIIKEDFVNVFFLILKCLEI